MAEKATTSQTDPLSSLNAPEDRGLVVKCAGLTKVFSDFWMRPRVRAVDSIDFEIYKGEVFGLLGPNGSGKSTTIKMILGLLHPTSGHIAVFGHHPRDVRIKGRIGYLPEESYLYPFLNARETLDYYGRLFHQAGSQRQKRIEMLLEMVGLDRVARRPVGEYSKGMARRIGLAQALINDPQLLILDEPTTGMDPIGTADVKKLIQTLARRGKTILLCSHLLADVEDVCDRVAIMYGGQIHTAGTVDELLEKSHTTSIQTQQLDEQTLEELDAVLEKHGQHIERVEHPRQRLEQLFLDIVADAKSKGRETSGAGSGGKIAAFLEADSESEADRMLEGLMQTAEGKGAAPKPAKAVKQAGKKQAVTDGASDVSKSPSHMASPPKPQDDQVLSELMVQQGAVDETEAKDVTPSPQPPVEEPAATQPQPKSTGKPKPTIKATKRKPSEADASADGEEPDQDLLNDLMGRQSEQ